MSTILTLWALWAAGSTVSLQHLPFLEQVGEPEILGVGVEQLQPLLQPFFYGRPLCPYHPGKQIVLPCEELILPSKCIEHRGKSGRRPLTTLRILCYEFAMQIEWEGKVHKVDRRLSAGKLLEMFALSKEAHLVTVNGDLVTEDFVVGLDDLVKIIRVISGG